MSTVDLLNDVVRRVHSRFTYVPDKIRWKTPEYWISRRDGDLLSGKWEGDCDDFALICRAELNTLGIPNRLVFCYVPKADGYHLVTEVDGWLLDVNYSSAASRDMTGYKYISISGYNPGDPWHEITN